MNKFKFCLVNIYLLLSFNCLGQIIELPFKESTGEITQTKVVNTGLTKEYAFQAIHRWITRNYPDYREIIQVDDVESGKIIFRSTRRIYYGKLRAFTFNVTIDVKIGKYSCLINGVKAMDAASGNYFDIRMGSNKMDKQASDMMVLQFDTIQIGLQNAVLIN